MKKSEKKKLWRHVVMVTIEQKNAINVSCIKTQKELNLLFVHMFLYQTL